MNLVESVVAFEATKHNIDLTVKIDSKHIKHKPYLAGCYTPLNGVIHMDSHCSLASLLHEIGHKVYHLKTKRGKITSQSFYEEQTVETFSTVECEDLISQGIICRKDVFTPISTWTNNGENEVVLQKHP